MEGKMFRVSLILLLGVSIAFGQEKSPRKLIASMEGKDLYLAYCASCHGKLGKGDGPVASALKGPLADLTTISKRNRGKFPREEMEKIILGEQKSARSAHGSEQMPVWGPVFSKVEKDQDFGLVRVRRVVEYLISIQAK